MKRLALIAIFPALVIAPPLALVRYLWAVVFAPDRAVKIAIGFDQLANVAANGSEDETISSRANRARSERKRWGCILCKLLDRLEKNHCRDSSGT